MEVPGDSVSVVEHAEHTDPFVEAGVLNGDARSDRQGLSECLVLVAEIVSADFVGEIQVAVDHRTDSDGDAEEGFHGRVVSGESVAVGMGAEVLEAQWCGIGDQHAEHPSSGRAGTDRLFLGVAQSNGDKRLEASPCLIEHTEGAIASVDERTCLFDEVAEQDRKLDGGFDHEDGVDETQELGRILNVVIRHGLNRSYQRRLDSAGRWHVDWTSVERWHNGVP